MDLVGTASGAALEAVLGELIDRFQRSETRVLSAVDRLERGFERQQVAAVREAVSQLELGAHSKAQDLLLHAEALEPYGAVIKLLLGVSLYVSGSGRPGADRLATAYDLNPFLVHEVLGPLIRERPSAARVANEKEIALRQQPLIPVEPEMRFQNRAAKRMHRWRSNRRYSDSLVYDAVAIDETKADSARCVLRWLRTPAFGRATQYLISAFDLASADLLWSRLIDASRHLILGTPSIVVCLDPRAERVSLFSARTGTELASMSFPYYESLLAPGRARLLETASFVRSHQHLTRDLPELINEALTKDLGWSRLKRALYAPAGGDSRVWRSARESCRVETPFGSSVAASIHNEYSVRYSGNPLALAGQIMRGLPAAEVWSRAALRIGAD